MSCPSPSTAFGYISFGTTAKVYRTDGSNTTVADEATIKRLSKDLVYGPGDRITDYADFELEFIGSHRLNRQIGVAVKLTSYFVGDDERNDGLSEGALLARDRPIAEQFGDELERLLGATFQVEVYCGEW